MPGAERNGVLVLHVWIEVGNGGLFARITAESDLGSGERVSLVVGSVDDIVALVHDWVEKFAAADGEHHQPVTAP